MKHQLIAILDFGSQYTQLIARRVREQQVYAEILPYTTTAKQLADRQPTGIILSGGPNSVFEENAPTIDPEIFKLGVPILGICYGMQLAVQTLGGKVHRATNREYGQTDVDVIADCPLLVGLPRKLSVWMSHGDSVEQLPPNFGFSTQTDSCPYAVIGCLETKFFGLQFHPEVAHTEGGSQIINNFLYKICGCTGDWQMSSFIDAVVENVRAQVGDGHVMLGLSGGVDSSVVAALLDKAIGKQLHCVFVDHGLLRYGEAQQVEDTFQKKMNLNLRVVDAKDRFYAELKGVTDPEAKRKVIGKVFIDVFTDAARELSGTCKFLAQGTIYPDIIESQSPSGGPSTTIKSHHNVGGLPPDLKFDLVEPLRDLFKDEVRALGRVLKMDDELLDRQPFPGPGLGVRILGEITAERVAILQQADIRVQEEFKKLPDYKEIWQSFAILLPVKSVGVMGDCRTYENVCAIRAVHSVDAMTADWMRVPYETLAKISNRIINEVAGINRVVYDISSKPPATIEWE